MGEKAVRISTILAAMKLGDKVDFPIGRIRSVRVLSSDCGLRLGRLYKTKSDRDTQTITVTRTK
jgi:hypothetical protein